MENVAALRRRGLGRVLGDLAALGYDAAWTSLRASDIGAAHRRERVFILGYCAEAADVLLAADANSQRQPRAAPAGTVPATAAPDRAARRCDSNGPLWTGQDWGLYTSAIRSWECVTRRPAPPPTEVGTRGQPRLAPAFVEWLMGLPSGFVTSLGLPYYAQLKALGNGVVPQQAEAALRSLVATVAERFAAQRNHGRR